MKDAKFVIYATFKIAILIFGDIIEHFEFKILKYKQHHRKAGEKLYPKLSLHSSINDFIINFYDEMSIDVRIQSLFMPFQNTVQVDLDNTQ